MGGRKLGGYTHNKALDSIPDDADIWFDHPSYGSPQKAKFSTLKAAIAPSSGLTPVVLAAAPQSLAGAGTLSLTTTHTNWESNGAAQAITLADATIIGQLKTVTHAVDGGSGVMTPTNFADGATVTFTTAGERWSGIWTGTTWQTIELSNVADGGAVLPAIA